MYKILIVDDEPAIRKGLVHLMPWDSLDCMIVAAAVDGIEAVELLKTEKPDIVITDIKMPGMNGLELSKHIYENYPAIKIIILTAYSDFDYSQSAIKYGAIDFILKPTSADKFIEAIEKAKLMIKKERENKMIIENLKTELSHQIQEIQENLLLKIMHGIESDPIQINNKCRSLQIHLEHYLAIMAKIKLHGHSDNHTPASSNHGILLTKKLLASVFKDYVHYTIIVDQHHICIFLNMNKDHASQTIENMIPACHELIYMAKNLNKLDLLLGISRCHDDISSISTAYEESMAALSNPLYSNDAVTIFDEEKNNGSSLEFNQMEQYIHYPSIIEKVDEYIMNHYHENISLSTIADVVHLNSSYLSRYYKKETNITLTEKITHVRMERAKILLKTTNLKIYEIASIVGIENSTYFSISFNKYTGHYPKEYRAL